mgnify:CR=1 FL=1
MLWAARAWSPPRTGRRGRLARVSQLYLYRGGHAGTAYPTRVNARFSTACAPDTPPIPVPNPVPNPTCSILCARVPNPTCPILYAVCPILCAQSYVLNPVCPILCVQSCVPTQAIHWWPGTTARSCARCPARSRRCCLSSTSPPQCSCCPPAPWWRRHPAMPISR